jgi:hypothetical protein
MIGGTAGAATEQAAAALLEHAAADRQELATAGR